ncbi:type I-E CRISPR-associated protein Cse2/CasB [Nocardiopsis kunsanensis]|uniref:type I-E CRISPR-associated protein Cse2/CasB n=1 Tax=Nocardiopsis kunsanensis TaxID=141693 RepID=UPI001360B224|nr:type I-E CRISPR-associated protein Cse2/CasB [Nocardiopsis kunsanensis]
MAQTESAEKKKSPNQKKPREDLGPLGNAVSDRVTDLMSGYIADNSEDVATLAQLRSGAGHTFGSCPRLWGMSVDPAQYERLWERPRAEERTEKTEQAAEEAVHAALTLFALHQQSLKTADQGMHIPSRFGRGIRRAEHNVGWAVRGAMPVGEIEASLHNRLRRAAEASSHTKRVSELRQIVQRLRGARQPLDYGLLAEHLYRAQRPRGAETVKDAWGHGFASFHQKKETSAEKTDAESAEGEATAEEL